MKAKLFALFVALLMVGCGGPDLEDPETLDEILADAIDWNGLQIRGKEGEKILYAPNEQTPYTGWAKLMWSNGRVKTLTQFKDGKNHGLVAIWYESGQKKSEANWKDGKVDGLYSYWYVNGQKQGEVNWRNLKLMSAEVWKPNGEKCPVTNVKDGNGLWVWYKEDGTEGGRTTIKDGKLVRD